MYLRTLHVQRLKLLRDVTLDFTDLDGKSVRKWTVIIGENGTGKSSLLQAIALAAAGSLQVNTLAGRTVGHLRDRRTEEGLRVDAGFEFPWASTGSTSHPLTVGNPKRAWLQLESRVRLEPGESTIYARSGYRDIAWKPQAGDPLDIARSRNLADWFVAAYGVARFLPDVGRPMLLDRPSIERMQPLFDPTLALTSTNFANYFAEDPQRSSQFHQVLKRALLNVKELLPGISDLELRGRGGVSHAGDLLERDRFALRVGRGDPLKVPGLALAHGYQSTIAWLADLVGHALMESARHLDPSTLEGLVLVDEIDLYLHPIWQATLIPALRKTFPRLQFVVTTHSPVVLSGVAPHEIVRVASDPETGDVREVVHHPETGELVAAADLPKAGERPDARMMTGSEIYREYFGLDRTTPNPMGDALRRYTLLAGDPFRTDGEDRELKALRAELVAQDVHDLPPTARRRRSA